MNDFNAELEKIMKEKLNQEARNTSVSWDGSTVFVNEADESGGMSVWQNTDIANWCFATPNEAALFIKQRAAEIGAVITDDGMAYAHVPAALLHPAIGAL